MYDVKDVKVRDYCRVTSKYKSSAQKKFNVNFILTFKVPVIFHNARWYVSHHIIKEIVKLVKFICYTKWCEKIYDSYAREKYSLQLWKTSQEMI